MSRGCLEINFSFGIRHPFLVQAVSFSDGTETFLYNHVKQKPNR